MQKSLRRAGSRLYERLSQEPSPLKHRIFQIDLGLDLEKVSDLRYGENPHQQAALYIDSQVAGVAKAKQLHGKEMSFNNYVDADAAWALVNDFDELAVAIIKHTNPSGVGVGETNLEAYKKALATDPVSAFGGIVAFNHNVDAETAAAVIEVFSEVISLLTTTQDATRHISESKKNLRVLTSRRKPGR